MLYRHSLDTSYKRKDVELKQTPEPFRCPDWYCLLPGWCTIMVKFMKREYYLKTTYNDEEWYVSHHNIEHSRLTAKLWIVYWDRSIAIMTYNQIIRVNGNVHSNDFYNSLTTECQLSGGHNIYTCTSTLQYTSVAVISRRKQYVYKIRGSRLFRNQHT